MSIRLIFIVYKFLQMDKTSWTYSIHCLVTDPPCSFLSGVLGWARRALNLAERWLADNPGTRNCKNESLGYQTTLFAFFQYRLTTNLVLTFLLLLSVHLLLLLTCIYPKGQVAPDKWLLNKMVSNSEFAKLGGFFWGGGGQVFNPK